MRRLWAFCIHEKEERGRARLSEEGEGARVRKGSGGRGDVHIFHRCNSHDPSQLPRFALLNSVSKYLFQVCVLMMMTIVLHVLCVCVQSFMFECV